MDLAILIVGLSMIGLGFLVKSYPDLIGGYNTMPNDKKKNVDIEGLSTYLRNGLIIIGLSIIIGYYLIKWIGFPMIANSMMLFIILIGVTIIVVNAQKFDHNKKKRTKLTYFILGIIMVFVIGLLAYGFIPSKTVISNDNIRFSGMYGIEIKTTSIKNAELSEKIPTIKLRSNGFSFGHIHKGIFNLDEFGKCRLLLHSNRSPYLILSMDNGNKIIVNFKDKTEIRDIYKQILQVTGHK